MKAAKMHDEPRRLRLIWADKIVLWLAIVLVAAAALAWLMIAIAAGIMGANHVVDSLGNGGLMEIGAFLLALWATFRALDFIAHGATYKLFHAEPAPDAPVLPSGENLLAH